MRLTLRAAKTVFKTARVNERPERRPGMPSILRRSSPRDALSDTRLGPTPASWLCHHGSGCRRLCYSVEPCEHHGAWVPVHAPLATGIALLWTSASFADFCNRIRRADTPTSRRSSPASEALTSLLPAPGRPAKDERVMLAALATWVRCRTQSLRAATCTHRLSPSRSTCVDEAGHGPEHSRKANARS